MSKELTPEGLTSEELTDVYLAPEKNVRQFMLFGEQVIGYAPGLRDQLLRIRLISEEAAETCRAIYSGDIIQTIDGLCDLLYVTYGAFIAFGIDVQPFFNEVHRSNISKVINLTKDKFGKVTKPEGWKPPDIESLFRELYGDPTDYPSEQQSHENSWQHIIVYAERNKLKPDYIRYLIDKDNEEQKCLL